MSSKQALAIAIGNTHLKAAIGNIFDPDLDQATSRYQKITTYTVRHDEIEGFARELDPALKFKNFEKIAIASVVPHLSTPWHGLVQTQVITSTQIPIANLYETIGVDRALVALGAGAKYGYPVLVIDAGTAITITGIDEHPALVGGAILPGIYAQFQSLHQATAALPEVPIEIPIHSTEPGQAKSPGQQQEIKPDTPERWATDTVGAIKSGVWHTIAAGIYSFIQDWCDRYPGSGIVFTGGDGKKLQQYLNLGKYDSGLIFDGITRFWDARN
ncbi:putative transcriptional acitvator, Baf family [Thalassoporum mexicanum PCC 7367]|uniref:type III pantothenate kinase n=1 Tax=Thalassoporum mexicanum TaxID=3457544 RepID=UPI00029F8748|nr:type III pantothenate kinase [Pseudanabaena sp. PCC 7367]AFY68882.1 putative transcriptional acitvator, Baf family [Pseudanabaena sp. PCC 7367]